MGDVANFSKGTGYSKSDLKGTGSPIILYGRLYTKYETIIRNVDSFVVPKSGSVFSKGGEVIVPGSGETAEDISIASVVEPAGILLGGDLNIIYPNSDLDPTFLAITISNGKPHFDMARRAQGKSIVHLHNADLKHISLKTPNLSEQKRISKIFEVLDQTITLHEEKKSQLERLKSALLQKMFADKSGYPAVRFRGFDERWEQYKAKELFESKSKKDHSDLPVLSATQENGIVFRNDLDIDIKFDTHALSNYKVVSPGDYIISLRSFQGGFELSEKLGIISPAYTVFAFNNQEKNRQNSTFWKYLFKRYDFIESLKRLTFGIRDGKAISFNQFSTLKLSFPNFDEQNKIATLLHELDKTIALHDQKLSLLKHVKQSLLQNMFI